MHARKQNTTSMQDAAKEMKARCLCEIAREMKKFSPLLWVPSKQVWQLELAEHLIFCRPSRCYAMMMRQCCDLAWEEPLEALQPLRIFLFPRAHFQLAFYRESVLRRLRSVVPIFASRSWN
jgi:hypothetical protein